MTTQGSYAAQVGVTSPFFGTPRISPKRVRGRDSVRAPRRCYVSAPSPLRGRGTVPSVGQLAGSWSSTPATAAGSVSSAGVSSGSAMISAACSGASSPESPLVVPGHVGPGDVRPGDVGPGDVAPGHIGPGDEARVEVGPEERVPRDGVPGDIALGHVVPADAVEDRGARVRRVADQETVERLVRIRGLSTSPGRGALEKFPLKGDRAR